MRMFYENGIVKVHKDFDRGRGIRFISNESSLDTSRQYLDANPVNILDAEP